MKEGTRFIYIYWFCVSIVFFGAGLTIFLIVWLTPEAAQRVADTAIIFWLSTGVSGVMGYLIGSSAKTEKGKAGGDTGTTTAEFTASVTTEPVQEPKTE